MNVIVYAKPGGNLDAVAKGLVALKHNALWRNPKHFRAFDQVEKCDAVAIEYFDAEENPLMSEKYGDIAVAYLGVGVPVFERTVDCVRFYGNPDIVECDDDELATGAPLASLLGEKWAPKPEKRSTTTNPGTPLTAVLPTGAWAGRRCFILGGGPSLRGFDFSRLAGELVIGVNRAFEAFDPAILYSMDMRYLTWVMTGEYGDEAAERFDCMRGTKAWLRANDRYGFEDGIYRVDSNGGDKLTFSLEEGFCQQNNSGFGALNLALCLGCTEIFLLGFDMHGDGGKQAWWHNGHPQVNDDSTYRERMIPLFEQHAKAIADQGVRVVNLNPDSALKCFEFSTFDEVMESAPTPVRPVVVGYYTPGTGYEVEARQMVASAHRMGLNVDVRPVKDLGGWQRNTQYKARFLRDMVRKYKGRTIVYTDADSRFVRYPELFDRAIEGIAYHLHNGDELLSGTLQIACNDNTARLMDLWVRTCQKSPKLWDQKALAQAVAKWGGPTEVLPKEYCCIFDSEPRPEAPVVLHYQASRFLKEEVGV